MHAVTSNFIVWESDSATLMANRFVAEFEAKRAEMNMAIEDLPDSGGIVRAMVDIQMHKGMGLRSYQKHVMDTYNYYLTHMLDDDLFEEIAEGRESSDIHDIIQMITAFETSTTEEYDVLSIIPLDLKGVMGFVIQPKLK